MELTWPMKIRISAAMAVGVLLAMVAWPLVKPEQTFTPISFTVNGLNVINLLLLCLLAFIAAFISYFLTYPYGSEIGVIAVPAAISVLAIKTHNTSRLLLSHPDTQEKLEIFHNLKWEPFLWLIVLAAGFAAVIVAAKIKSPRLPEFEPRKENVSQKTNLVSKYLSIIIAVAAAILISYFCLKILAQGIKFTDSRLGPVVGQPSTAQIFFAVTISFAAASFAIKKILDVNYLWTIAAIPFVSFFTIITYARPDFLAILNENWPVYFYHNSILAILPVQIVGLGSLGAILGYWFAIRFDYWHKHEMK